ncbi:MAG: hypothetical protein AB3N14_16625 [Flavobacteriaceae bacterium]
MPLERKVCNRNIKCSYGSRCRFKSF